MEEVLRRHKNLNSIMNVEARIIRRNSYKEREDFYESEEVIRERLPRTNPKTKIWRVSHHGELSDGAKTQNRFIVKQFLSPGNFKASRYAYDFLKTLDHYSGKVPKVYPLDTNYGLLVLQDLGNGSLEKRFKDLRRNQSELSEKAYHDNLIHFVELGLRELKTMHTAMNQSKIKSMIRGRFPSVERRLTRYFRLLRVPKDQLKEYVKDQPKDELQFMEKLSKLREYLSGKERGEDYPLWGDVKTSHFLIPKCEEPSSSEEIYMIDPDPALGPHELDIGPYLFSPSIRLPEEELRDIYRKHYYSQDLSQPENYKRELRTCFGGLFDILRRCAHIRKAAALYPQEFKNYSKQHEDYVNPELYRQRHQKLIDLMQGSEYHSLINPEQLQEMRGVIGGVLVNAL